MPRRDDYGAPSTSPLLASRVLGLSLDAKGLAGTLDVRVGQHDEAWQVDLKREGGLFKGTCTRRIPPLSKPVVLSGVISGKVEQKPDGSTWQIFSLEEAISQRPTDLKHPRVVAHLVVETRKDGSVHHFVRAGEDIR